MKPVGGNSFSKSAIRKKIMSPFVPTIIHRSCSLIALALAVPVDKTVFPILSDNTDLPLCDNIVTPLPRFAQGLSARQPRKGFPFALPVVNPESS